MSERDEPSDDELLGQAADWMIRIQGGAADPDALAVWRARSDRHEAVWLATERMWTMAGAVGPAASSVSRRTARRRWSSVPAGKRRIARGVAALMAAGLLVFLSPLPIALQADYRTSTGNLQHVALSDGSKVVLDSASAIAVDYAGGERRVRLLRGRAFFDVAHDGRHPFRVVASDVTVTVTGTAFDVDRGGDGVDVALARGSVTASWSSPTGPAETRMTPGHRLTVADHAARLTALPVGSVASWQRRHILADGATVAEVAAELGRYHSGRIVITNAALGQRRVTGVYDTSDPVHALALLVQPHGGHVWQLTPWLVFVSAD